MNVAQLLEFATLSPKPPLPAPKSAGRGGFTWLRLSRLGGQSAVERASLLWVFLLTHPIADRYRPTSWV